jgi:hypothetical protein
MDNAIIVTVLGTWGVLRLMPSRDRDIDRLYQLPLEQFTEARNALAARAKAVGDSEDAARVRALEKPSLSAWAVNQLYWSAGGEFDELVAAGTRLRQAQERALKGAPTSNVREASERKDRAVAAALREAAGLLERAGGEVSQAVRQRIATTLEAIAIQGGTGDAKAGRLVADLPLPGFAALAALAPGRTLREQAQAPATAAAQAAAETVRREGAAAEAMARAREESIRGRVDRARAALAAAEADARAAREALMKASLAEHEAAVRADAERLAVKEAKARLAASMTQATHALEQHKLARRRAVQAQTSVERASAAVTAARETLRRAQTDH